MEKTFDACVFEIKGEVFIKDEQELREKIQSDVISHLNEKAPDICREIKSTLKQALPFETHVDVEIEFYPGSLLFVVIVSVVEWMGKLAAAASLVDYLARAIRITVNRGIRAEIERFVSNPPYHVNEISTNVEITARPRTRLNPFTGGSINWLFFLIGANSILTLAILIVLLAKIF